MVRDRLTVVVVGGGVWRREKTRDGVGHLEVAKGRLNERLDWCGTRCLICALGGGGRVRTIHFREARGDCNDNNDSNSTTVATTATATATGTATATVTTVH
jgi:hypothetical protein